MHFALMSLQLKFAFKFCTTGLTPVFFLYHEKLSFQQPFLNSPGIQIRRIQLFRFYMEWVEGFCFIVIQKCIVAFRKDRRNVIAAAFEFRMIYHTNRAVTAYPLKFVRKFGLIEEQELVATGLV